MKTGVCRHCKRSLSLDSFKLMKNGKRTRNCKSCIAYSSGTLTRYDDLSILLTRKRKNSSWTLTRARLAVKAYIAWRKDRSQSALEIVKKFDLKVNAVEFIAFCRELLKAAKAKMTIKQYLDAGRPFKVDKVDKVLVKAAK